MVQGRSGMCRPELAVLPASTLALRQTSQLVWLNSADGRSSLLRSTDLKIAC
jgi:hypothetical protein